jgi:dUTP pyrophosphatase
MKIKLKLIDDSLPLPSYQTDGSVAFDLYSRIDLEIKPKSLGFVPLNIVAEIGDKDYALLIVPRSSTPKKKSLLIPHGIGIIDHDFCGEDDEIHFQCYNFSNESVKIEKGERIAQGILVKTTIADIEKVDNVSKNSRGGFGSTG